MGEYEKYQIPHTGVDSTTLGVPTQSRSLHEKMSNWNAPYVDARMPASQDYTRTVLSYQFKDDISDWHAVVPEWQYAERDENPYVLNSSVKRVRDDQFFRMFMSNDRGTEIDPPKFDVMDTKVASAAGMTSGKNYPTEGWKSYGKKYDGNQPYVGW